MLQKSIKTLCQDLNIKSVPKLDEKKKELTLPFLDFKIIIKELKPGIYFKANICQLPLKKREDLLMRLMQANLIGQGTGGSVIGLDKQEKFLTLSLALAYELNYQDFKEALEDFVNYLAHWKEEVESSE